MITQIDDPAGPLTVPNTPFMYSATQASVQPWVAAVGQHTDQVLTELLRLSADRIDELTARRPAALDV